VMSRSPVLGSCAMAILPLLLGQWVLSAMRDAKEIEKR
jgi:hypothetical protein